MRISTATRTMRRTIIIRRIGIIRIIRKIIIAIIRRRITMKARRRIIKAFIRRRGTVATIRIIRRIGIRS